MFLNCKINYLIIYIINLEIKTHVVIKAERGNENIPVFLSFWVRFIKFKKTISKIFNI